MGATKAQPEGAKSSDKASIPNAEFFELPIPEGIAKIISITVTVDGHSFTAVIQIATIRMLNEHTSVTIIP
ncbi:MAG: hypothetical protein AAF934_07710 [Bacteroidota bacterium]